MQGIETAWKKFFKQFTPNVYVTGEYIEDHERLIFPRITFSYKVGEYFDNTLTTFEVWTYSFNNGQLGAICDQIALKVPTYIGTTISILSDIRYEYQNPTTFEWLPFEIVDFQLLAEQFAPVPVEWRKVGGENSGAIEVRRGTPFLVPSPKDEPLLRVAYGTLKSRHLTTL